MSEKPKPQVRCRCGGIILADTEDWKEPICNACYEAVGCPEVEPQVREFDEAAAKEKACEGLYFDEDAHELIAGDKRMSLERIGFVKGARWQHSIMREELDKLAAELTAYQIGSAIEAKRGDTFAEEAERLAELVRLHNEAPRVPSLENFERIKAERDAALKRIEELEQKLAERTRNEKV